MAIEPTPQDFKFQSTLGGVIFLLVWGVVPILLAIEDFKSSVMPSGHGGSFSFRDFLYRLLLWALGWLILNSVCDVQILDGQFRFRRIFNSKSVPLKSITCVRRLWLPPSLYVRIDYAGKRYRVIFSPGEFRLGPSVPPVYRFLQEVCKRNAEEQVARRRA